MVSPLIIEREIWKALHEESSKHIKVIFNKNSRNYKCSVLNCNRPAYAKGLCNAHYIRSIKSKDMSIPIRNRHRGLYCIECGKKITEKGGWNRCERHYKSKRRNIIKNVCVNIMGGKCLKCGGKYPLSVYDFHHIKDKDKGLGDLFNNRSIKKISEEISKCTLLCANCHRILHNGGENV